ncbi:hypothetical protein HBB16_16620 [Pseudonocardia sp. MCCB 268]|nr:hypothetical protein [Pseudonocardia cytotoxica]
MLFLRQPDRPGLGGSTCWSCSSGSRRRSGCNGHHTTGLFDAGAVGFPLLIRLRNDAIAAGGRKVPLGRRAGDPLGPGPRRGGDGSPRPGSGAPGRGRAIRIRRVPRNRAGGADRAGDAGACGWCRSPDGPARSAERADGDQASDAERASGSVTGPESARDLAELLRATEPGRIDRAGLWRCRSSELPSAGIGRRPPDARRAVAELQAGRARPVEATDDGTPAAAGRSGWPARRGARAAGRRAPGIRSCAARTACGSPSEVVRQGGPVAVRRRYGSRGGAAAGAGAGDHQ